MKKVLKYAGTIALTGALAIAAVTPSQARDGRNAAAAVGFAAGAAIGAAAASDDRYYYGGPYAYEPAPVYVEPAPRYRYGRCWHVTDDSRGYGYYGACY